MTLNPDKLRSGLIFHVRSHGFFGRSIRNLLSHKYVKEGRLPVWGNHDAITARSKSGKVYVGDAEPFAAHWRSIGDYQRMIASGVRTVRVFEVIGATLKQEAEASDWWDANIKGTIYDFWAFPRLAYKCVFPEFLQTKTGKEWANWCTEGVARAFAECAEPVDAWGKSNPTPLTTEKRAGWYPDLPGPVTLRDITSQVVLAPEHAPSDIGTHPLATA